MDKNVIVALAIARVHQEKASQAKKDWEAIFKASQEYQDLDFALREANQEVEKAEKQFTEIGLADYDATHEKKCEAHEIRLFSTVEIEDEKAAIDWSIHNFTPALSLNKKVFETAVKAGTIPDGLAIVKETPKIYIKSDLSAWLKEE